MIKLFKYSLLGLLAVLGFASCTDSYSYDPAKNGGNYGAEQVYFSNTLSTTVELNRSAESFVVPVNRVNKAGELQVNITVNVSEDVAQHLTIPTSVTFADGADVANLEIAYVPADIIADWGYDVTKAVELTINNPEDGESITTPFGASSYSFDVVMPSPYKLLGTGTFFDALLMTADKPYEVEIYQNEERPNIYRVMKPYHGAFEAEGWEAAWGNVYQPDEYLDLTVLRAGGAMTIDGQRIPITEKGDGEVWFSSFNTGYYNTVNDYNKIIYLLHPGYVTQYRNEDSWLHNIVKSWQEDGETPAQVQLAPYYYMYGLGGYNYTQDDGMIVINFPGADIKNYDLNFSYNGRFTDPNDNDYGDGTYTLGADLTEVHYAVVPEEGTDLDAAIEAIKAGTMDYETITESGDVRFRMNFDDSGNYIMLAVGYDGSEVVQEKAWRFYFRSTHEYDEKWTAIATGLYSYTTADLSGENISGVYEGQQESVLYRSQSDENRYRILPWASEESTGLIFSVDPTTNVIVVPRDESDTGENFKAQGTDYGRVYAMDLASAGAEGSDYASFYTPGTKTYSFGLVWYTTQTELAYTRDVFTVIEELSPAKAANLQLKAGNARRVNLKGVKKINKIVGKNISSPTMKLQRVSVKK